MVKKLSNEQKLLAIIKELVAVKDMKRNWTSSTTTKSEDYQQGLQKYLTRHKKAWDAARTVAKMKINEDEEL